MGRGVYGRAQSPGLPALQGGVSGAAGHQPAVDEESALLPKGVGRQAELKADDQAPQELRPLAPLLALACHSSTCQGAGTPSPAFTASVLLTG